jgi:phytoene synthase
MALYAFHHELARIGDVVHEPMLGEIRLQWWREALEGAQKGSPRAHDTARGLVLLHEANALPLAIVEPMMDAHAFEFSKGQFETASDLELYLDRTSGGLMRLASRILGGGEGQDALAREAGIAYGLIGLLRAMPSQARRAKVFVPLDILGDFHLNPETAYAPGNRKNIGDVRRAMALRALSHLQAARSLARPGPSLAAVLPATLVPLEVRHLRQDGGVLCQVREVPIYRRQIALLAAAIRGQI